MSSTFRCWFCLGIAILSATPVLAQDAEVTVTVGPKSMTAMKSSWADYFGTHYAGSPDGAGAAWNTVRSYGGTHVGFHVAENKDVPALKGPFTGKEVRIQLADFHAARGGKSAENLIPELIKHKITGIYIMTNIVRPSTDPFDKDRAYGAVRLIHKTEGLEEHGTLETTK
ncbi:MAG: hypothetical protein KDA61_03170 [Planctomycetales bacterium]|nr:hypothetical protein [Planctomycetales bacterium]